MKHFRMLAAGLCSAVLLCGFAIPAYAYSDGGNEEPPVVEETPHLPLPRARAFRRMETL
jgi:hypothetical protein